MTTQAFSLPSAAEVARRARSVQEAEEKRLSQLHATGDAARAELIEALLQTDEFDVDEVLKRTATLIRSASERGLSEILVARFPSETLMDHGRAIIAGEPEWPGSLRGQPLVMYNVWRERLKPLGYGLRVEILDYRDDLPGDVGSFLIWGDGDK